MEVGRGRVEGREGERDKERERWGEREIDMERGDMGRVEKGGSTENA